MVLPISIYRFKVKVASTLGFFSEQNHVKYKLIWNVTKKWNNKAKVVRKNNHTEYLNSHTEFTLIPKTLEEFLENKI